MTANRRRVLAFLAALTAMFLATTSIAQAEMAILDPTADAYVDTGRPTTNFGKSVNLYTRFDTDDDRQAAIYFKFDLSNIPRDSTISEATVRIRLKNMIGRSSVILGVYRATSAWDERSISWQTRPVGPGPLTSNTINAAPGYKSFDVTNLVMGWLSGTYPDHGLFLADQSHKDYVATFYSSEALSNMPQMVVYYEPPSTATTGPLEGLGMASGRPPLISNVFAKNIRNDTATVVWTTDGMTSSRVRYGLSAAYSAFFSSDPPKLQHEITLHDLQPGRTYHYRVGGRNKAGMECLSADYQFRTPPAGVKPVDPGLLSWGWLRLIGFFLLGFVLFATTVVAAFEIPRWRRGEKMVFRFRPRG